MMPVLLGSAPPMQRPTRDLVSGRHGGERVPSGGSCERRAADTSSPATRSRSGKSAAPALPAAARRRPCPPGGTLAVRPRPETESRVALLARGALGGGHGQPLPLEPARDERD